MRCNPAVGNEELIGVWQIFLVQSERRKYQLPQKKFRHIAKTKISNLTEQKKKFERELRKAKGKVSKHKIFYNFVLNILFRSQIFKKRMRTQSKMLKKFVWEILRLTNFRPKFHVLRTKSKTKRNILSKKPKFLTNLTHFLQG